MLEEKLWESFQSDNSTPFGIKRAYLDLALSISSLKQKFDSLNNGLDFLEWFGGLAGYKKAMISRYLQIGSLSQEKRASILEFQIQAGYEVTIEGLTCITQLPLQDVERVLQDALKHRSSDKELRSKLIASRRDMRDLSPYRVSNFPQLVANFHPSKNGDLTPEDLRKGTRQKIWWVCERGHEWECSVRAEWSRKGACPICSSNWTNYQLREFVARLLPHYDTLTQPVLFSIVQSSGLLQSTRSSFGLRLVQGLISKGDLEEIARGKPISIIDGVSKDQKPLPRFPSSPPLDRSYAFAGQCDEETVRFIVATGVSQLWRDAYRDESRVDSETREVRPDVYAERIRHEFRLQFDAARTLEIPSGYRFRAKSANEISPPLLMQRHFAALVKERRRIMNLSEVGSGKTLSAILSAEVIGSQETLILCPLVTVRTWSRAIVEAFPSSIVITGTLNPPPRTEGGDHRYLIVHYDLLQQPDSEEKVAALVACGNLDMVVIDETHLVKQRDEDASQRRRLTQAIVVEAARHHPDLAVVPMTGTPVINNLVEPRSLIELVTGKEHEDLKTEPTIGNAMAMHRALMLNGVRWVPETDRTVSHQVVEVDCTVQVEELRSLEKRPHPQKIEEILTRARIPEIVRQAKKGTLVYTYYVDGIVDPIVEALVRSGWRRDRIGIYTGEEKSGLEPFCAGEKDILVCSGAMGLGFDGLQHVANRIIVNSLPWTAAEWVQLLGRIDRDGQEKNIEVIFIKTRALVDGEEYSWCQSRFNLISGKRDLASCTVDGRIPPAHFLTRERVTEGLYAWLERLSKGEVRTIERKEIQIPLDGTPVEKSQRLKRYGDFSTLNSAWNRSSSEATHFRLKENPEEWEQYHTLFREARAKWGFIPNEVIIEDLKSRRAGRVIGDFGCGEADLARQLSGKHTVHSFDHIAINDAVTACDMIQVPLEDRSLDVAVFCLSLMGSNSGRYLQEGHRTLDVGGQLITVVPKRHAERVNLRNQLYSLGFDVSSYEPRGGFVFVRATRADRASLGVVNLFAEESAAE